MRGTGYDLILSNGHRKPMLSICFSVDLIYWQLHHTAVEMNIWAEEQSWSRIYPDYLKRQAQLTGERKAVPAMPESFPASVSSDRKQTDLFHPGHPSLQNTNSTRSQRKASLLNDWRKLLGVEPSMTVQQIDCILQELAREIAGRGLLDTECERWIAERLPVSQTTLTWKGWIQCLYLRGEISYEQGIAGQTHTGWRGRVKRNRLICSRCGSAGEELKWTHCASCEAACPSCAGCLTMGRCRSCSVLIKGTLQGEKPVTWSHLPSVELAKWSLSPAQTEAVQSGLSFLQSPASSSFLIWAVTGAGKTEMIYPLIEAVLAGHGRVAVASPRRDVILELKPRMDKAFPEVRIAALYGGSEDSWCSSDFILATTHQLMRFREAFDLLIIDELDAFPYHQDERLYFAARQARKTSGKVIFLSATPPASMRKQAKRGQMPSVRVPVRFHRHPLPVPQRVRMKSLRSWVGSRKVPSMLIRILMQSMERGAQLFLFSPAIRFVEDLVEDLRTCFPQYAIAGTSSKDPKRAEKVTAFRNKELNVLVTTTILERGVTIPKSDVCILDADSSLYDEAALVQMAGRAGRSPSDPCGRVYFCSTQATASMKEAIGQITDMNRLAQRKGYLR
ncbi:DEAD/DEAH box helicase [Marinicrinis sediminis]|uniref:DEAD/DEAH box helicase n=1 Tax=Marinicrinis sediminis TaxID=1652465 RepID=A0ABW5RD54_9BACL